MTDLRGTEDSGEVGEDFVDGLYLGDAIRFFLDAKRAGGRSERTILWYRKKLDLFQRWAASRLEGEGTVDVPVSWIGPDEVEGATVASGSEEVNHLDLGYLLCSDYLDNLLTSRR